MRKILVVDDEARIAELLEGFLIKSGFDVIKAFGGQEAIEILNSGIKIDLMVLDMKMPEVSGCDVLLEMERINRRIPTLIFTGSIDAQIYLREFRALGYTEKDILYKPVDLFELLNSVKKKLKNCPPLRVF